VTLGHHLLAYREMLVRDRSPLRRCALRWGGRWAPAALARPASRSTARSTTAALPGFDRATAGNLDAVSDRDFAVDYLHAAALTAVHLSRLAEEIILWASQPFGFIKRCPTHGRPDRRSCPTSAIPTPPSWCAAIRRGSSRPRRDAVNCCSAGTAAGLCQRTFKDDKPPVFDAADLSLDFRGDGQDDRRL
jgi:argininosuccinate lyase